MIHRRFRFALPWSLAVTLIPAAPAWASGYIPMPDGHETLPSFRACLARLDAAYAEDRRAEKVRVFTDGGGYSEVGLETRTKGIERAGRHKALYHGRLWYAHGRIATHDATQREVSHSWRDQELLCQGRRLTIKSASGYTLSTFEPISSAATAAPAAKAP